MLRVAINSSTLCSPSPQSNGILISYRTLRLNENSPARGYRKESKNEIYSLKPIVFSNALNNGVTQPDLELIKQQAPQLVSKAAELERVDWVAFLKQSKEWIQSQSTNYKVKAV